MPVLEANRLTQADLDAYERDGYLIVRGLFSPEEVAEIRETFMEEGKNGPVPGLSEIVSRPVSADDPLTFYPRMMHPHRHPDKPAGRLAMRYLLDARVGAILEQLFGEEAIAVQSMFYFKPPGARGQDLHQDNFYLRVKPGTCMAAWAAIDPSDMGNGGMMLVPGSHHGELVCPEKADNSRFFTTEHVPVPEGMEEVPALLNAGDVLFFNGSVIHGSYPNDSPDRFRRALICHYVPRSTAQMSHWYADNYTFDGERIEVPDNPDGGPCGVFQDRGVH
jgi:phytanoyl-CoA hydroxylase